MGIVQFDAYEKCNCILIELCYRKQINLNESVRIALTPGRGVCNVPLHSPALIA